MADPIKRGTGPWRPKTAFRSSPRATDGTSSPPSPQDSQWLYASRNYDQPQPWFSRRVFAAVAAAVIPGHFSFAAPQQSPEQQQPQLWKQQLDLIPLAAGQGTFSPQQVEPDRQPWFSKGIFPVTAQTPTPNRPIFAAPQDDPTQIQPKFSSQQPPTLSLGPRTVYASPQTDPAQLQPWFVGQTIGQRVPTPLIPLWTASPQADPSQIQPVFSRQVLTSVLASPIPFTWNARPQDDLTQLQPQIWRQQLTSAAAQPTLISQWSARPQDDTTQIQPWFSAQQVGLRQTPPSRNLWTAGPQSDPTQISPWFSGQVPPSQATQAPPTQQWFSFPQADTTQIQPSFFPIAFIPSVPAPSVDILVNGGLHKMQGRIRRDNDEDILLLLMYFLSTVDP